MKNRITLILASVIFTTVLVLALNYPGEIIIKLANYPNLTINLYFFITILIVLSLLLGGLLKIIIALMNLPARLSKTHHHHQTKKDEQLFHEGLHLYLQGDYAKAAQLLIKAAKSKTNPQLIAGLFAADAALLDNDTKTAYQAMTLANASPGEDAAADIIAADIAIGNESPESAAFRINDIVNKKTSNLRAVRMLIKLCEKTGAWHLAEQALWQLDRALHDAPRRRQQIRTQITSALLRQAAEQQDKQRFNQLWHQTSETIKEELLELYITLLVQLGDTKKAELYLEKAIELDYNEDAIKQYSMLPDIGTDHRIKRTERWLVEHPDNPALLLCLARLYRTNAQLDKAKEYFEKSLAVSPDNQAWYYTS